MTAAPVHHAATDEEIDRIFRRHLAETADRPLLFPATDDEARRIAATWDERTVAA